MGRLLVVGAGLTGATIARLARDDKHDVTVLERRDAVGGNVRDAVHDSGQLYGVYGPHYFRTSSSWVWEFVNRFADWYGFAAVLAIRSHDTYYRWPLRRDDGWDAMTWRCVRRPENFEEACLQRMPVRIYEQFVRGYTEKQWGIPAIDLSPNLANRFPVRSGQERRLKVHRWQALPVGGYARCVERMLGGCEVVTGTPSRGNLGGFDATVYTGSIDEYFGFKHGHLGYRAQRRELDWHPDVDLVNPEVQVNLPDPEDATLREIEWKHMTPVDQRKSGSLMTREVPFTPNDPDRYEYPVPSKRNADLYAKYHECAERERGIVFAGRLGEYRYLDMDQAIARARKTYVTRVKHRLGEN